MSTTLTEFGIDRMNPQERRELAEAIWESLARDAEEAPITAAQRSELEKRLADSIARPEAVTPWEEVKTEMLARAKM